MFFQHLRFIVSLFSGMASVNHPSIPFARNCHRPEEAEEWAPDFDQLKGREVLFVVWDLSVGPLETVGLTPDTPKARRFFGWKKTWELHFFWEKHLQNSRNECCS